ncbi:MAG: class I SAM-dependent methyltransferase [Rhodospirillales bacterium]
MSLKGKVAVFLKGSAATFLKGSVATFLKLLLSTWSKCIKKGVLIVTDASGNRHEIGDGTGTPVEFTLHDASLYWKMLINPRLALGEAYMDGTVTFQQGDAYELAALISLNMNSGQKLPPLMRFLEYIVRRIAHLLQFNYPGKSRKNVVAHYDFTDSLYDLLMDSNLQYSCGYFTEEHKDIERAQRDKIRHIAGKLRLEPGLKVLDIGCGWGDLACVLAKETGCHVTGIALADEQIKRAKERAKREGLEHLTDFRLEDYRHHEGEGKYDRVVSVGMMEHVGLMYYETFMQCVNKFLKDDGVAMVHHIVRLKGRNVMDPFVLKYIFLNCYTPTLSEVTPRVERSGLIVTDIEIWRLHYNRTILLWREKWRANKAKVTEMYDERLYRMFEHYLSTAAAGFNMRDFAVMHLQMAKRLDTLPMTRDYITEFKFNSDGEKAAS